MMNKGLREEALRWLRQAESDLSALKPLMNAEKFDIVCFLSQQVTKKALKALLYFIREELIMTHSIFRLCQMAGKYDRDFEEMKNSVKKLDFYYLEARYPNALEDVIPAEFYDKNDAGEAIKLATRVVNLVKGKFGNFQTEG